MKKFTRDDAAKAIGRARERLAQDIDDDGYCDVQSASLVCEELTRDGWDARIVGGNACFKVGPESVIMRLADDGGHVWAQVGDIIIDESVRLSRLANPDHSPWAPDFVVINAEDAMDYKLLTKKKGFVCLYSEDESVLEQLRREEEVH